MAHHLEQIQLVVKQSQEQLLKDFLKCADGVRIIGPQIWDVREKTLLDSEDNASVFRRVYIKVHDSGDLKSVGWIMDDCSEQCFLCASHFSSVAWKHHCRRCGLTVCAPCSPHRVLLKCFENQGVQRVCKNCSPGDERIVPLEDNTSWGASVLEALRSREAAAMSDIAAKRTSVRIRSHSQSTVASKSTMRTVQSLGHADLWSYGSVNVRQVAAGFVFQVSRPDRSIVFFNVCANKYVPLVDEGTDFETAESLFFVVGTPGKTEEGMDVYDVVVHPRVVNRSKALDSVQYKRIICERILSGMEELGLEGAFSILFILPDSFPYRQRSLSDQDLDAAELDRMHLKATGELEVSPDRFGEDDILTAVVPSAAAFYHFPHVSTTRRDLARSSKVTPAMWNKYNHIILRDSGTLSFSQPGSLGTMFGGWGKVLAPSRTSAGAVMALGGLSELRVETRQLGVKAFVRGTITLTPTGGYAVEAPKIYNDFNGSELDSASVANGHHALGEGTARPRVRINVLLHPIVDDLVAMGVVRAAPGVPPILLSDPGSRANFYNVLVQTNYVSEVEGRVGTSYESRIVQIIKNINRHYVDAIDEEQFMLTELSSHAARTCFHLPQVFGAQPLPQDPRVTFTLYEYPLETTSEEGSTSTSTKVHGLLGSPPALPNVPAGRKSKDSSDTTVVLPFAEVNQLVTKDFADKGVNGSTKTPDQFNHTVSGKTIKKGWTVWKAPKPKK